VSPADALSFPKDLPASVAGRVESKAVKWQRSHPGKPPALALVQLASEIFELDLGPTPRFPSS